MKLSQKLAVATTGVALSFVAVGTKPAHAQNAFDFQYSFPGFGASGTPVSATGILNTTDLDPATNAFTITGISGTRTVSGVTESIIGLLAPGSFGGNDNLLFASQPFLSNNGVSFFVAGAGNVNVFFSSDENAYTEFNRRVGYGNFTVTPRNATPVPGPEFSPALSFLALGAWGTMAHLKRKKQKALKVAVTLKS